MPGVGSECRQDLALDDGMKAIRNPFGDAPLMTTLSSS